MTITQIIDSVQFVVDETGHKKAVQLDIADWQEILLFLDRYNQPQQPILTYEAYYAERDTEDENEEIALLDEFAVAEAQIQD